MRIIASVTILLALMASANAGNTGQTTTTNCNCAGYPPQSVSTNDTKSVPAPYIRPADEN